MTPRPSAKNTINTQDALRIGGTTVYCGAATAIVVIGSWVCQEFGRVLPNEVQGAITLLLTIGFQTATYYFSGRRR